MKKFLLGLFCAIVVDAFFWDFVLNIFPVVNSKMVLAVIGLIAFIFRCFQERTISFTRRFLVSGFLAVVFSLWCYIAITLNNTDDKEFVLYFESFAVWVGGAYGVVTLLKMVHERVDLMLITRYLAIICLAQCIIALLIDNVPAVESIVKRTFKMSYDLFESNGRLYGIGCALDPAGIRFSAVLVLMAHQLVVESRVRESLFKSGFLFVAFLVITIIGSMISRTTIVGCMLGLVYIAFGSFRVQRGGYVSSLQIGLSLLFLLLMGASIGASVYLYNTSSTFHEDIRFGFEGFFNWAETGEFRTGSTDQLQNMWVWPTTRRGWLIGEGIIGVFKTNSDIGYCNYILYCGLIGLFIYSIYYIFNHWSLTTKFQHFTVAALLLTAVTFIVWAKVTTDIFLVDALLFCIDADEDSREGRLLSAAELASS